MEQIVLDYNTLNEVGVMRYDRLVDLRDERDWTQKAVASELNISQRAYSYYENGSRAIPIEILIKIADLYGVSLDYLVGRTNVRKPYPRK